MQVQNIYLTDSREKKSKNKHLLRKLSWRATEIYLFFLKLRGYRLSRRAVEILKIDFINKKNSPKQKLKIKRNFLFLVSRRPAETADTLIVSKKSKKQRFVHN
jgi:hypothetical protein